MDFNSIKDPMVRDYLMSKYGTNKVQDAQQGVDTANTVAGLAGIGDVVVNNMNKPAALHNRMQDLGKAPTMVGGEKQRTDVSGLQKQAQMKLQQATSDEDNAVKAAFEQRKAELAAEAAASRQSVEDDRWNKSFAGQEAARNEAARHNKAMEGLSAQKAAAPKPPTAAESKAATTKKEVDYRVNSIKSALDRLENNVKENGTFELLGEASSAMDSDLYNLAVDYAKLVDPESVAREGEVAAAQKYMLPIKGMGVRNETALAIIQRMRGQVEKRSADMGITGGSRAPEAKPATVTQNGHTYTLNPQTGEYE